MKTKIKSIFEDNICLICFITVIILVVSLVVSIFNIEFPKAFFVFSNLLVTILSIFIIINLYRFDSKNKFIVLFFFIALLYNPIKSINLSVQSVQVINTLTLITLLFYINAQIPFLDIKQIIQNFNLAYENNKILNILLLVFKLIVLILIVVITSFSLVDILDSSCESVYYSNEYKKCKYVCTLDKMLNYNFSKNNILAYSYYNLKEYENAIFYFNKIKDEPVSYKYGLSYVYTRQYDKALENFKTSLNKSLFLSSGQIIESDKKIKNKYLSDDSRIETIIEDDYMIIREIEDAIEFLKLNVDEELAIENMNILTKYVTKMRNDIILLEELKENYNIPLYSDF